MKKISIYSILAAAALVLGACNDDYKDWAEPENPAQPADVTISFQPAAVGALDLRSIAADSVVAFTPNLTVSLEANTYYELAIYNADKSDHVTIKANAEGKVRRSELQGAIVALYGNVEESRNAVMDITAYTLVNGSMVLTTVQNVAITATPKQQELPPVWYIIGNCVGRGTWVNHATMGLYTSTVAMYVNPYNYEELVYASYFCDNAELRIILKAGDKNNYIGADANARKANQDNFVIEKGGYYKIIVNTTDSTLRYEAITGEVKTFDAISMVNGGTTAMSKITTHQSGENHDWLGDATFAADATAGQGLRFVAGDGTSWGGYDFPAGKALNTDVQVPYKAGTYKVVYNDLLGLYRFIAR